jgi:Na+-transporting NADH:ubiquinone oxidoreductase subunit NqrD
MDPIIDNPAFLMVFLFVYSVVKVIYDSQCKIGMYLPIAIYIVFVAVLCFIELECKFIMDSCKMCCQIFIFYLKGFARG